MQRGRCARTVESEQLAKPLPDLDLVRLGPHSRVMSRTVDVHEAKTHLSRLLEAVERGEDVVIARAGKPVARLVPARSPGTRRPGAWKGRVVIAADFDHTPEDLVAAFHDDVEPHP
jgi:prevent-host-death family protein